MLSASARRRAPAPPPAARRALDIVLAAPRGFCAGVQRAVTIVEQALQKFGAPVYVVHEIVHNQHVVARLQGLGAVFVDDIAHAEPSRPVIFSAHGVPRHVIEHAKQHNHFYIDATCPLVQKVHAEALYAQKHRQHIILIGHRFHVEVTGTLGQVDAANATLVENAQQAENLDLPTDRDYLCLSQTTLSLDDTKKIRAILSRRFPRLRFPPKEDICYATENRQNAVKQIAAMVDMMLVIGSTNSSNSARLKEVALAAGCKQAFLIPDEDSLPWKSLAALASRGRRGGRLGLTAGASAPESLVESVLGALGARYAVTVAHHVMVEENVVFKLPPLVRDKHGSSGHDLDSQDSDSQDSGGQDSGGRDSGGRDVVSFSAGHENKPT